jgi:hypothetical protein
MNAIEASQKMKGSDHGRFEIRNFKTQKWDEERFSRGCFFCSVIGCTGWSKLTGKV